MLHGPQKKIYSSTLTNHNINSKKALKKYVLHYSTYLYLAIENGSLYRELVARRGETLLPVKRIDILLDVVT